MSYHLILRPIHADDLEAIFQQEKDPVACHMAAFTHKDPTDREHFYAHWKKIMAMPAVTIRTILVDGQVAGTITVYPSDDGQSEVTYWLGREFWNRGVASLAMVKFLEEIKLRPIRARVAKDNAGSLKVLQKAGFIICGEHKEFAHARQCEVEEYILELASNVKPQAAPRYKIG